MNTLTAKLNKNAIRKLKKLQNKLFLLQEKKYHKKKNKKKKTARTIVSVQAAKTEEPILFTFSKCSIKKFGSPLQ